MYVGNGVEWSPTEANRREEEMNKNKITKKVTLRTINSGQSALNDFLLRDHALPGSPEDKKLGTLVFIILVLVPLLSGAAGYIFYNKNPFIVTLFIFFILRHPAQSLSHILLLDFSAKNPGKLVIGETVSSVKGPKAETLTAEYDVQVDDSDKTQTNKADHAFNKAVYTAWDFGKNRTQQLTDFRNFALSLSVDFRTKRLIESDDFFKDFLDFINSAYDEGGEKKTIDDILHALKNNPDTFKTLIGYYFAIKLGKI